MFTKKHLSHLASLRKTELEASKARIEYQEKLVSMCDHSLILERGYGYEDTLGHYAPERGTTDWHCAMCGKRVATGNGREKRPEKIAPYVVYIPGSITMQGNDVRSDILRGVPQTRDDVVKYLAGLNIRAPNAVDS